MVESMGACRIDWGQAAEAVVRRYCGWHVAPVVTETLVLDVQHASPLLPLPSLRVEAVHSVEVWTGKDWIELDAGVYGWSRAGMLQLLYGRFSKGLSNVRVTLRHGFDAVEAADVLAIVRNVQARGEMELGAVRQQAVNGASVAYTSTAGGSLSVPLFQDEKATLDAYRLPAKIAG